MYFSFTSNKIRVAAFITALLALAVFLTFEFKTLFYGNTDFSLLFSRVVGMEYQTLMYDQQAAALGNRNSASVSSTTAFAIPVLTYHAIITDRNENEIIPESFEGHNVGLEEFEDQMFTLKRAGWETLTLLEYQKALRGKLAVPEKSFLLTFDDGAKESYYPVDPLLRALSFEAVTFILPEYSTNDGTHYYLSQNELIRAEESGRWEIGSHGLDSHYFVPTNGDGDEGAALANRKWMSDENKLETIEAYRRRVLFDLAESKKLLEEGTDRTITTFAYPFGDFGQLSQNVPNAEQIVTKAAAGIYDFTFYQWWKGEGFTYNYIDASGSAMNKRISVQPSWTGDDLLERLEHGFPKTLPFSDTFDSDVGWLSVWGDIIIAHSMGILDAGDDQSGSAAILDGTGHWNDYSAHMEVESPSRTGIAVYVRFKDINNHAVCNFGNGFAHVEQVVDGTQRVIKGNRSSAYVIPEGTFTIDVVADGRSIRCSINGKLLVDTDFLDASLLKGGIGFKAWDKINGKSVFNVKTLIVEAVKSS